MRIRPPFPWFLLAGLVAALVLSSTDGDDGAATGARAQEGRVLRVVDGDTIRVRIGGRDQPVRLIGVDTPESVKPGAAVECFGKEAASFTRRELDGERVRVVRGEEPRDRYGRLLAYVYRRRDNRFHNAALLRAGYAEVLTIGPNDRHAPTFRRLAAEARAAGRGLWRAC